VKTSDFDYSLPPELIAQTPVEPRDGSRLMVLDRSNGLIQHRGFVDLIDYLKAGDVLVFNNSRVIPARLKGEKAGSGANTEVLLLRRLDEGSWEALARPSRRLKIGAKIEINSLTGNVPRPKVIAEVIGQRQDGIKIINLSDESRLSELGETALPPYIHVPLANPERYQTVYASVNGSVAAPTAGLHFTPELLGKIEQKGVCCLSLTLHIGLDTFRPVRVEDPKEHHIYQEYGVVSEEVASKLSRAKAEGRRVICVGTTSVRLVEHLAQFSKPSRLEAFEGWVSLFILPGYQFRIIDALLTNFHLPKSTLLMLVTAFAGKDFIKRAYEQAIAERYRFYSFGDAMLII